MLTQALQGITVLTMAALSVLSRAILLIEYGGSFLFVTYYLLVFAQNKLRYMDGFAVRIKSATAKEQGRDGYTMACSIRVLVLFTFQKYLM